MKLQITPHERGWLRLLGFGGLVITGILFLLPLLPASYHTDEPLADAESLRTLTRGGGLSAPPSEREGQFHGKEVRVPWETAMASLTQSRGVLGDTTAEDKRIEVDLSSQKVYAYQGDRKVYEFIVSTGKWARTPTGEFRIWAKVRSQKMSGGDKSIGTYYYLPNVPYVMFFSNDTIAKMRGFSFHGTYWHDNFGHPMSHGCVNMRTADAQTLYEWASPVVTNQKAWSTLADATNTGTRVLIYGETPSE